LPLEEAANHANHAAGIAVSKMGTTAVSYKELFEQPHHSPLSPKIMSLSQAALQAARWKRKASVWFTKWLF